MPVLIVPVILVLGFLVVVALLPAQFRIVRTTTTNAPTAAAFAQVNDFHNWEAWSPWAKIDPASKKTFEGAPSGEGAVFSWSGNKKVGEGRMTLLESKPYDLIRIKLEFFKPFAATNTAEFTFEPVGNQTKVTWSMFGKRNFMSKAFCLFVNMDKLVGGDFERGLSSLKTIAEASGSAQ